MKKTITLAALLAVGLWTPAQAQDDADDLALYFSRDELVQTATRSLKPMSQVAENVTIITAEEIQRMNAHSVAEILNRVPGVFMQFNGRGFNQSTSIHIQDADFEHALVLLDGIRWNDIFSGMAEIHGIPVEVIDRIEIIKGPASSTWGSSLGGVVNIITKNPGKNMVPSGTLSASYGEYNSQEYNATINGKAGPVGYFLSAGSQSSDGFLHNRFYDRETVYGKLSVDLPHATTLTLSSGYSEPGLRSFDSIEYAWREDKHERHFWNTVNLDSIINENLTFNINVFRYDQKFVNKWADLSSEIYFSEGVIDSVNQGFSSRMTFNAGSNVMVFGGEFERAYSEDEDDAKDYDESWALYFHDTYTVGSVNITPGIRYDHLSLSDNFISPSLGITWQVTDSTLLRALVSKGFRKPYMYTVNYSVPGIEPEEVTSYQLGVETSAFPYCLLKSTFFTHKAKEEWTYDESSGWRFYNAGKTKRYGYELVVETIPVHHFSVNASFTYVYTDYYDFEENDDSYSGKINLIYDNPELLTVDLFGRYMWWNEDRAAADNPPDYGTMIWDLSVTKSLQLSEKTSADIYCTAHNLFDGRDYWIDVYDNAHRWVEGGVRFHF